MESYQYENEIGRLKARIDEMRQEKAKLAKDQAVLIATVESIRIALKACDQARGES